MSPSRGSKVMWALWMGGGGLAAAAIVYLRTDSLGWAAVTLLASGIVLNAIAQLILQPIKAVTGSRRFPQHNTRH